MMSAGDHVKEQPWGTNVEGSTERARPTGRGTGVGGASLAGTPAGPGRENAEAETSGLRPPVGTPHQPAGRSGPTAEPPRGPGAFVDEASAPPVYDE